MVSRKRKGPIRRQRSAPAPVQIKRKTSLGFWWFITFAGTMILAMASYVFLRSVHTSTEHIGVASKSTLPAKRQTASLSDLWGPAETLPQIKEEELKLARHIATSFPADVHAGILLGNVYYQHGDIPKAMDVWTQTLSLDSREVGLYLRLGIAAADLGQTEQALSYWRRGLQISPDAPELRWRMANVYIDLGQLKEAAELLEQACKITPNIGRNFFLLGQTYLDLQDYDRAKANYERAIELAPDYYNAYYGLANVYLRLQDREKAKELMGRFRVLKEASEARVENQVKADEVPDARKRMARCYAEAYRIYQPAKQHPEGETLLKRAVQLDPNNTSYLEKLGVHYFSLQRLPEALAMFEWAKKIDPNNPLFYLNISKIYVGLQRFDQAEQTLLEATAHFPASGLVYAEFAQFYLQTGRNVPKALVLAQQAVQHQATAAHYFLLAWARDVNQDHAGALQAIERAMALAPQNQKYRMQYERIKQKM